MLVNHWDTARLPAIVKILLNTVTHHKITRTEIAVANQSEASCLLSAKKRGKGPKRKKDGQKHI